MYCFKMYNSGAFSAFTMLCNRHLCLDATYFIIPNENPKGIKQVLLTPIPTAPGNH